MLKFAKVTILGVFTLLLSFSSYKLCYFLAENYFFDKIFNGKDTHHGYRIGKEFILTDYGDRSKDTIALDSKDLNILGVADDKKFTIAVVGDSYVWGVGLRNNQRFAHLLEQKLNKIRPTKIISLGFPGNNTQDYLETYDQLQKYVKTDLNIFSLVGNDAFVNTEKDYLKINYNCISMHPGVKPVYDIYQELYAKFADNVDYSDPHINELIDNAHEQSWTNPINHCSTDNISKLLPVEKSIYFITDNYDHGNSAYDHYQRVLEAHQKYVISSELGKNLQQYKKYWNSNVAQNFKVSTNEGHPNALANKMYADILYNEITSNPRWKFSN